MKMFMDFIEVGFALVALTLFSLFCCYAWPDSTYGLAAWFQAVGSVAAIFTAFQIANGQAARQEKTRMKEKFEERLVVMETVHTFGNDILREVERLARLAKHADEGGNTHIDANKKILANEEGALRGIPMHCMGDPHYVLLLAELLDYIEVIRKLSKEMESMHPSLDDLNRNLAARSSATRKVVAETMQDIVSSVEQLKARLA
jgi:hypothetical protein